MARIFVSTDTAQIVSFVAKISTGLIIPKLATLFSIYSTSTALILSYFGRFTNIFSVAQDVRWRPSIRSSHARAKSQHERIKGSTWLLFVIAIILASIAVIIDLVLFQFSERRTAFVTRRIDATFPINDTFLASAVGLLQVPGEIIASSNDTGIFSKKTFLSRDGGVYHTHSKEIRDFNILSGGFGKVSNSTLGNNFRCTSVITGLPYYSNQGVLPIQVKCFQDNGNDTRLEFDLNLPNSFGFAGNTIATYYQTDEGANYLFAEVIQREYMTLRTTSKFGGIRDLSLRLDSLFQDDYTVDYYRSNNSTLSNPPNNRKDMMARLQADAPVNINDPTALGSTILFSKDETLVRFDTQEVPTSHYALLFIKPDQGFFSSSGEAVYSVLSFDVRHLLIAGKEIRPNLIGLSNSTGSNPVKFPQSIQYTTVRTDDEIVLSTIQSPNSPEFVFAQDQINIVPGLVVCLMCGGFAVICVIIQTVYKFNRCKKLAFDIDLEIFHKALENCNTESWLLPAKMELSDDLVMSRYASQLSSASEVGLKWRDASEPVSLKNLISRHSTEELSRSFDRKS